MPHRRKRPVQACCRRCGVHVWIAEDDTYDWHARHRCRSRSWTEEEDAAVRAATEYGALKVLAVRLGRSYATVSKRASVLRGRGSNARLAPDPCRVRPQCN